MLIKFIMILQRESPTLLYTPYMVPSEEDENKLIIWETNNNEDMENKLKELLSIYPKAKLFPMDSLTWMIDVILGDKKSKRRKRNI